MAPVKMLPRQIETSGSFLKEMELNFAQEPQIDIETIAKKGNEEVASNRDSLFSDFPELCYKQTGCEDEDEDMMEQTVYMLEKN